MSSKSGAPHEGKHPFHAGKKAIRSLQERLLCGLPKKHSSTNLVVAGRQFRITESKVCPNKMLKEYS